MTAPKIWTPDAAEREASLHARIQSFALACSESGLTPREALCAAVGVIAERESPADAVRCLLMALSIADAELAASLERARALASWEVPEPEAGAH